MNGIKRAKLGLKQLLQGALINIGDTKDSSDEERIILVEYFSNSAVDILNFIDEKDRSELISIIQKHLAVEPNQKIKALLSELVSKI
jgi:hypothetical protein